MRLVFSLLALVSITLSTMLHAEMVYASEEDKVIRLSSLEWPPYAGADLPEQGATIAVVRAALEKMGYELEVTFFPWSRAVNVGGDPTSGFAGYFPEYYSDQIDQTFEYSDPVGYGPLGFVQPSDTDVQWDTLTDLNRYLVGVVKDYVNTKEFDELVALGELNVSLALNDTTNLLKVAYRRIDIAVIDQNVMNYLLAEEPDLRPLAKEVSFNRKLLDMKSLYVCFNYQNHKFNEILNQGLASIDVNAIQEAYFARLEASSQQALHLTGSPSWISSD